MARNFKRVRISSTPTAPTEGKEPIAPTHEGKEPTTPTNETKESTASILAEKEASATRHDREDGNAIGEGPSETDITDFTTLSKQLEEELGSVVVGQERVIRELLLALLAGGHVLLE